MLKEVDYSEIDLNVIETLASRICHDLINPVSAINNGVELMSESDLSTEFLNDALKLIEFSGEQVAKRLQIFRLAYGKSLASVHVSFNEVVKALLDYFSNSRIELIVDPSVRNSKLLEFVGFNRIFLNSVLTATELMQLEGEIITNISPEDPFTLLVTIEGKCKELSAEHKEFISGKLSAQNISVYSAVVYMFACYAKHHSVRLNLESVSSSQIILAIHFTPF